MSCVIFYLCRIVVFWNCNCVQHLYIFRIFVSLCNLIWSLTTASLINLLPANVFGIWYVKSWSFMSWFSVYQYRSYRNFQKVLVYKKLTFTINSLSKLVNSSSKSSKYKQYWSRVFPTIGLGYWCFEPIFETFAIEYF